MIRRLRRAQEGIHFLDILLDETICEGKILEKAVPVVRERIGERLLVKNAAKCRVTEQLEIPESQEKILQICACEGTVRLEKYEPVENGIRAERSNSFRSALHLPPARHIFMVQESRKISGRQTTTLSWSLWRMRHLPLSITLRGMQFTSMS